MNKDDPLRHARKIGLLGDVHGDTEHLLTASRTFWRRGIDTLIQLGDFGFVWRKGENSQKALDKISRRLDAHGQTIYFVDGNHEDFDLLYAGFPVDGDGHRHLRQNVIHLPRGYRTTLLPHDSGWPGNVIRPGKALAVLGGANSIDRHLRTANTDWWPEESISEADLAALGSEHADVLLGHDAPLDVPDLDRELGSESAGWPPDAVAYAEQGRRTFHQGFMEVRPELYVGAHYHRHADQTLTYTDAAGSFRSRVVILDQNTPKTISLAVLDTWTLHLEFLTRGDTTVERLTMRDQGRWNVHIKDAILAFDLDARTVERRPMDGARESPTIDRPLPLLNIRMLQMGNIAILTLDPIDDHTPYLDYFSPSQVEKIERTDGDADR
jgi:hypothetical protein